MGVHGNYVEPISDEERKAWALVREGSRVVEPEAGKCGYAKVFAWRDGAGSGSMSCADVEARCTKGGLSVRWQLWVETEMRVGSRRGGVVDMWDGLVEFTEVVAVETVTRILKSFAKELSYNDGGAGATVDCPRERQLIVHWWWMEMVRSGSHVRRILSISEQRSGAAVKS